MSSYSVGSSIGKDSAVVRLLTSLEDQAHEVDESLEQFTTTRNDVLLRQKQALADYEAEMLLLDREGDEDNNEDGAEQYRYMDPNIMRHLNVDRESDYTRNLMATLMPSADKKGEAKPLSIAEFPIRKESERPKDQPAPTFNEKKKLRETLFLVMDESAIEETRIELAYEEARDSGDFKKASELADALYFLQRMHSDRLNDLIAEYKPEPFSKAWGSDPEYIALSKQLNTMAETLDAVELTDSGTIGKKGKKGKKK